jgi:hypothetical protein
MTTPIGKVLDEDNCGRATDRGEEACECVRNYRPDFAAGHILVKAARLRTETPYKAGSGRPMASSPYSHVLLETVAQTEASSRNAD